MGTAVVLGLVLSALALVGTPGPSAGAGQPVVYVVGNGTAPTAAEQSVVSRLTTAGYNVTVVDDAAVTTAQVSASAFAIVAQSAGSTSAVLALRPLATPLWIAKPGLFPTFGLTGPTWDTDHGILPGNNATIAAPGHPMAAGRTGTVAFQTSHSVSWGKPPAPATIVATTGTPARATIFALEPGDTLTTGSPAPACRLTFPLYTNGPTALTTDGNALLVAAADWATGNCTTAPPPPPPPPPNNDVVFVVGNGPAPTTPEQSVRSRLATAGYDVTVVDDAAVTTAQVSASAFAIVAQSAGSTSAVLALRPLATPLWIAKPGLFPTFGLTGPTWDTDHGILPGNNATIAAPGHPMAAGRTGTVAFQTSHSVSWGKPPAPATIVATTGTPARATIFALEPGDTLTTGSPAPACRLTFPLYTNGPTALTTDGNALLVAAADWATGNCTTAPPPPPPPPGIAHVVVVSVDGLNPNAITTLGTAGAPNLNGMRVDGASTLNARTAVEITRTLPNHTSMFTGRTITGAGGHQVTFNDDNGSTLAATAGSYVAGAFDVVHDAGRSTVFYSGTPKLAFLDRSWNATNGALDTTGTDNGRDKIDLYQSGGASTSTDALVAGLQTAPPALSFIHYGAADTAGHTFGFLSTEYLSAVSGVDAEIGEILDAVSSSPTLSANTVVIVTADHGGTGTDHSNATVAANFTIPFLAVGAGVTPGADLYALNPDRQNPGTSQPAYTAPVPPIRNGDVANLVTDLLGLPVVGGSSINAGQNLDLGP